ncbi:MAG: IS4 family transposase [Candidatus Binatota bacterium]
MQKLKVWKAENIIGLVPDEILDKLSDQTDVDYSVKKLQGKTIFKLFLFAALNGSDVSLSILEAIFQSERFKNLFSIQAKPASRAAFSFRFKNIRADYFENIFKFLIASPKLESVLFNRQKISISKIDTTIVTLSSQLLKFGLDDNHGIKTLKFGVELRAGIPVNLMLFKGQKYLSEDNALPKLILAKKQKKALNIAIFDRGIQRKQNFVDFQKAGVYFISRLSTQQVKIVKRLPLTAVATSTLTILSDQIIRFKSSENLQPEDANTEFRLVVGKNNHTKQKIYFLTNVLFLSAVEITELYKSRWEIETFFKFLKQQLNFSHLLSRNENGIKVVMYLTMIIAILLTLYKRLNNIMGWAVAKIRFIDELYVWARDEWNIRLLPVASLSATAKANSS